MDNSDEKPLNADEKSILRDIQAPGNENIILKINSFQEENQSWIKKIFKASKPRGVVQGITYAILGLLNIATSGLFAFKKTVVDSNNLYLNQSSIDFNNDEINYYNNQINQNSTTTDMINHYKDGINKLQLQINQYELEINQNNESSDILQNVVIGLYACTALVVMSSTIKNYRKDRSIERNKLDSIITFIKTLIDNKKVDINQIKGQFELLPVYDLCFKSDNIAYWKMLSSNFKVEDLRKLENVLSIVNNIQPNDRVTINNDKTIQLKNNLNEEKKEEEKDNQLNIILSNNNNNIKAKEEEEKKEEEKEDNEMDKIPHFHSLNAYNSSTGFKGRFREDAKII